METENREGARSQAPDVGDMVGLYRLVRLLGEGTTGRVFEVEHTRIARRAAMKIVHRDGVVPGVVNRLFVEARAVNLINHPHVVEITDILVPDAAQPDHALVMELLDGVSLADLVATAGALPPQRFLPILAQVCAGLAAVHDAGFVHRDLKPENVFLVETNGNRDYVKLLDFGLVKAIRGGAGLGKATVEGIFMGSPAYVSPEQALGKPVDARTDIYAVGVMLYELVTGEIPFQADSIADLLTKQVTAAPPRLSAQLLGTDLGRALDAIIQACMIKDREERTLTAAQLAEMFRRLAAGDVVTPDVMRAVRGRRLGRRGRRRLLVIGPVAALAAFGLFALTHRQTSPASLPVAAVPASAPASLAQAPAAAFEAPPDQARVAASPSASSARSSNPAPVPKRWGRTPRPVSKATTLDPYR